MAHPVTNPKHQAHPELWRQHSSIPISRRSTRDQQQTKYRRAIGWNGSPERRCAPNPLARAGKDSVIPGYPL
jgi:hypothetical protein